MKVFQIGLLPFGRTILVAAGCALVLSADAQKATELYIPIGQSPGLSGRSTLLGEILEVDLKAGRVTVQGEKEKRVYRIPKESAILLCPAEGKLPHRYGQVSDLKKGQRVEVKWKMEKEKPTDVVEWMKVEMMGDKP